MLGGPCAQACPRCSHAPFSHPASCRACLRAWIASRPAWREERAQRHARASRSRPPLADWPCRACHPARFRRACPHAQFCPPGGQIRAQRHARAWRRHGDGRHDRRPPKASVRKRASVGEWRPFTPERGGGYEQEGRRADRGRAGARRGGGLLPRAVDAGGPRRAPAARQAAPDRGRGPHHIPGSRDLRPLGPLELAQAPAACPRHHPRACRAAPRLGLLRALGRARPRHLRLLGVASKDARGLRPARRQEARRPYRPSSGRRGGRPRSWTAFA